MGLLRQPSPYLIKFIYSTLGESPHSWTCRTNSLTVQMPEDHLRNNCRSLQALKNQRLASNNLKIATFTWCNCILDCKEERIEVKNVDGSIIFYFIVFSLLFPFSVFERSRSGVCVKGKLLWSRNLFSESKYWIEIILGFYHKRDEKP